MKCRTIIDREHDEEVVIYVHEKNALSDAIADLVLGKSTEIIGYKDREIVKLNVSEICCFAVCDNKVYAFLENEKLYIKQRLYTLEEMLDKDFIKINQSCIANIKKIKKFDASLTGTLSVIFENGYRDYVSRRQLRSVKERMGI